MTMEFSGTAELDANRETAWAYFTDPDVLARCAPGCKSMTAKSSSELEATLSVGVGSVRPTFDVDIVITESQYPALLRMAADGDASRNAFETTAEMQLREAEDGTSVAEWTASAEVSGLLASLGQRALGSVTQRLVGSFFDDLEDEIQSGAPAESRLEAAEASETV
ncbi:CoxG family protein [Halogeometricum limi]|uniref:Carbon monoxide dehydrogenase subunit G n=1 Tax=Halogeometricum limi TaxID=555875 RepID=A0A1I6ICK4_9EURY|nr:carbon monoxide dehydrogenase subunit G [Halogeometricum limi]SFR64349.1 Carbon monoxide dehydrogenase subunit G [Halogeometricum limi]